MTAPRRSIQTEYNGRLFRSKLEADYARAFDVIGLAWEYEDRGRYFGDQFYLADFLLPRSGQFVEVKGVFEPDDCRKIHALLKHLPPRRWTGDALSAPDVPLIACVPGGKFYGFARSAGRVDIAAPDGLLAFSRHTIAVALMRCGRCNGWWFCDDAMSWACQCCGAYDGDHHLADTLFSPLPGFPDLSELRDRSGAPLPCSLSF